VSGARVVRAAMTQTVNAYRDMPKTVAALGELSGKLGDVRAANVAHHLELMASAKDQGARVICFGELFPGPYFALGTDAMWLELAEDAATGPTITAVREAARRLGLVTIAPIFELDPSGKRFNTAVVMDERGELLGKYRKTHIPYGANEQGSFHENFYYERSDGQNGRGPANVSHNDYFPVFETSLGRIGVAICYDRHFEGVMHSLAREGAEIVFSPAVTFGDKSERMWMHEFPVDAARHGLFIGGSNRKGVEPPWEQPYFGKTYFVGPNGPAPDVSTHPNLVIADLDLGELASGDPSGWNLPRDIRHDIYSPRK
jgi:beta-ureidopropionase